MAAIRLNADQWNSLPSEQQAEIINILKSNSLLNEGDSIVPDPEAPPAEKVLQEAVNNGGKRLPVLEPNTVVTTNVACEIGCTVL